VKTKAIYKLFSIDPETQKKKSKTNVKETSNLKILAGYSVYVGVCKYHSGINEMIITIVHLIHLL